MATLTCPTGETTTRRERSSRASGVKYRFSAAQWTQAVQAARAAKEALLGAGQLARHPVTIAAGGSRLLGGTVSTELTREEVEATVVEGFFPPVSAADRPRTEMHKVPIVRHAP